MLFKALALNHAVEKRIVTKSRISHMFWKEVNRPMHAASGIIRKFNKFSKPCEDQNSKNPQDNLSLFTSCHYTVKRGTSKTFLRLCKSEALAVLEDFAAA